jgi:hypothetical protein
MWIRTDAFKEHNCFALIFEQSILLR